MPPPRTEFLPGCWLDARRAIFLAATHTLVVADLHWGYATSHQACGHLLPAWGDEALAASLDALVTDYAPAEVVWLGDSLHTLAGRTAAEAWLAARPRDVPVRILRGNHDRRWAAASAASLTRETLVLHHGDTPLAAPLAPGEIEVVGHHHPAVALADGAGTRVKLPALVVGPRRWVLPAFSPWAAGESWNTRLAPDETLWAVAPRRIFAVNSQQLARLRASSAR